MPPDGVNVWMALLPVLRGIAAVGAGSFGGGGGVGAAGVRRTSAVRLVSFALAVPGAFDSVAGRTVSRASVAIGGTGTRGASSARSMLGAAGTAGVAGPADAAGALDAASAPLLADAPAPDAAAPALAAAESDTACVAGLNTGDAAGIATSGQSRIHGALRAADHGCARILPSPMPLPPRPPLPHPVSDGRRDNRASTLRAIQDRRFHTPAAVFHDQRNRDSRMIRRRECNKQRVITQMFRDRVVRDNSRLAAK